jgi:Mg-chelatase subunit ChlD
VLTASASGRSDADNSISYKWYYSTDLNHAIDTGATHAVSEADEGHTIVVVATATNGNNETVTATSAATAPVKDALPTVTTPTITSNDVNGPGVVREGDVLTAAASVSSDADNSVSYKWYYANDLTHAIGTGATHTVSEADEGKTIVAVATATNGDNETVTATSAPTASLIDNASLSLSVSVIANGTVQQGQTLVAVPTITDADDANATVTYQWQSSSDGGESWTNVSGAQLGKFNGVVSSFYQLTEGDEGKLFRATASFVDDTGQTISTTSAPTTTTVADVTPEITIPFSYAVDSLSIIKNGTQIYTNDFSQAPIASPTILSNGSPSPIVFITEGSTWTEVGGKAIASSAGVAVNPNTGGGNSVFNLALLNTNTDPQGTGSGQSNLGLKENAAFTITATFDLTAPPTGSYGMELTDGTATHGIDQLERLLVTQSGGNTVVELVQANLVANTQTVLASQVLTATQLASNDQIEFQFSHLADSTQVTGAFALGNNGSFGPLTTFSSTATAFTSSVTWTRVDVGAFTGTGVSITGTAKEGQTLTANAATNDPDATIHYQWEKSTDNFAHSQIIGTDSSTYVVQEADEGAKIRVVATTSDPDNSNVPATATSAATATVLDALPTITPVTISDTTSGSSTVREGDVLTASASGLRSDSDNTVSYSWYHSNDLTAAIGTGASYTVHESDENYQIVVKATATNGDNISVFTTSAASATVLDALPTVTTPTISSNDAAGSSTVREGDVLTASASSGQSDNAVTYAWYSSANNYTNPIGTGSTYTVQEGDEGYQIEAKATASNDNGLTTSATSAATATVLPGINDGPTAEPVEVSVDTDSQTNVMLIIDVSGSMNSSSGVSGFATRLDAAKAAMDDLLDKYALHGDVKVQIVKFSTGASQVGSDWMSVAAAKTAIAGLSANGSTYYDSALTEAMNIFGDAGKLSGSGTQNVSYFLSDGVPTENHAVGSTQQNTWESFLTTNNIISFALGISDSPTTTDLNPIAFDPASGTQLADTPIIVSDLNDLADTLVFTASSASGSLLSGANSFGADGGHVQSITVDGVTYTFNPTTNSITTSGGAGSGTYNAATHTLTVDTDTGASGGDLAMVMTTGAFTFQPSTGFSSESVGFVLVNGDGDTASSTLDLTASTLPAGVAGSPINLGLSDPAGHVGPVTVTIAGIPAGWTVNGGADNGHGGWTTNDVSALSITSPHDYTGATAFKVTMSWTNPDQSIRFAKLTDNVEAFAPGAPILAWSGDDHLTGSSGPNLFVFAQPVGHDTIYSFDASQDQIDLIGYAGFTSFNDVQRHLADDNAGNAVIALGAGQSIALLGVAAASLTAGNFVFDQTPVLNNAATMTVGDGALLPLAGIINNTGTIALDSAGSETHLQLIQYGMTLQGGGQLILSDSGENLISGTLPSVTLTNVDNTISGAGHLGAGGMTLVNDGTIIATGSHALVIDTGANVVTNAGTLEATGSGGLIVNSDVANSGLIWAHGGNITMNGAVAGSGTAMISGSATLGFGAASSADITFAADAAGTLTLKDAADFTGTISGFSSNDHIDLTNISYSIASVSNASYSSSTNITTLAITDGTSTDAIKFVGNYTINTTWHFSSDGHGGTLLTDTLPGASPDLAQTVTAALTTQDGIADQFTFQNDSHSSTPASDPTLVASADPSATNAATLDPTSSSSSDHQPTVTATADGSAVTGLASNVATNTQPATGDPGTQPGAMTQTVSAASAGSAAPAASATPAASAAPGAIGPNGSDTFVFAANFGNTTVTNFHPATDVIQIDHAEFANFQALLAATHDDGHGNAVIAADHHDTITVKNVTVAQLVQHQSDFHFT